MDRTHAAGSSPLSWVSPVPPEIWALVGEQIQSRETLSILTRVCRVFRDVFIPCLYSNQAVTLNRYSARLLKQKSLPGGLAYTKDLLVEFLEFAEFGFGYNISMNDGYASFLTRILKQIPRLRSFRWRNSSFEDYDICLTLRNSEFLEALKGLQTLKNLSIHFADQYLEYPISAQNCFISLAGFRNLTSLELYQFYGDEFRLTKEIASVLCECPDIKVLGLGLAIDYDCDQIPEIAILECGCNFLENLCVKYESYRNTSPLPLHTLRLGHGMCLLKPESPERDNFLTKLVQTSGLKTLHIFNGRYRHSMDGEDLNMEIDWGLLKDNSLHQLSVTRFEPDVRAWLNRGGKSVQELIITEYYTVNDDLEQIDYLCLPRLSMLVTSHMHCSVQETDTDSSEETDSPEEETHATRPYPADRFTITVLDRLHDGGSQLSRLSLFIDFEAQWVRFSSHLAKLVHLTQLSLRSKILHIGPFLPTASLLWPSGGKSNDIALKYAQLVQSICPSLQYIRIQDLAWQVITQQDPHEQGQCQVIFHELDYDEKFSNELFALDKFASQSGLTGPTRAVDEMIEEE